MKRKISPTAVEMSSSNSDDESHKFEELALDLNLDSGSKQEAWQAFQHAVDTYTLEGNCNHWLACAIWVACRKTHVATVSSGTMEGNGVSLTRLLRSANLSLIEFFKKMRKWSDMNPLTDDFRARVDRLERNFNVSTVIFKKFNPIWIDIFNDPANDPPKVPKSRKQKRSPCTATEVFNFTWTMFVHVKSNFPQISDDLVNSYHLLLCCVDWIYGNALTEGRKDLINKDFTGVPDGFDRPDWQVVGEPPCLIQWLCDNHDGIAVEAKGIKEHWWKPYIRRLFNKKDKKELKGNQDTLTGVLETNVFEANGKAIDKLYEEYVLTVGDFDERIFLDDTADEQIGTPAKNAPNLKSEVLKKTKTQMQAHVDEVRSLAPNTPFTNRHHLPPRGGHVTPVSTATQTVCRLQRLLSGRKNTPSDELVKFFQACSKNPQSEIVSRVKEMGAVFKNKFSQSSDSGPAVQEDMSHRRLHMAECLYYKILENITKQEAQRVAAQKQPPMDFSGLLSQDIFHRSLFVCCLEIVLFSYNSQRIFPWILDALGLPPYHFYKVIELLIRAEESLSRDIYKHLNFIEESILECLAWKVESPLWDAIHSAAVVPSVSDVSYANQIEQDTDDQGITNPVLQRVITTGIPEGLQGVASFADRFSSPCPGSVSVKRKLFTRDDTGATVTTQATVILKPRPNLFKPKRTGSLALFFRKVYHLGSIRLRDLCERLDIDSELRSQIWTCFEHVFIESIDLMKDRHLDQVIMCCIYCIAKVTGKDREFTDIIRCYRTQPQQKNHTYRSVLIKPRIRLSSSDSSDSTDGSPTTDRRRLRSGSTLPVSHPTTPLPTPQEEVQEEERGDIIKFYNQVFVGRARAFALRFSRANKDDPPTLSPMPVSRTHPLSPRRVSEKHSVMVSPLKVQPTGPANMKMLYQFNKSPAKDLRAINNMLRLNKNATSSSQVSRKFVFAEEMPAKRHCPQQSKDTPGPHSNGAHR